MYLCNVEWKIVHIDETESTNRWLSNNPALLHNNGRLLKDKLVIVADYQTAGRGCGTNTWESERGKNLLFSMLIHPTDIPAHEQFRISEMVSVALCRTLQPYLDQKVEIKWPNDIYVGDRKICGILIENRLQGSFIKDSIIGIGLNVNQREFKSDAPNPVSLWQLLGHEVDREVLLQSFLNCFEIVSSSKTLCFEYRNNLFRRGKQFVYAVGTTRFKAQLIDVEPDGRLVLQDEQGERRTFAFKEVQFII